MNFPKHFALSISHNEHKIFYEPLDEYLSSGAAFSKAESLTEDELKRCLKTDEIWEAHIYPLTPCSSYCLVAPTWGELMIKMEALKDVV